MFNGASTSWDEGRNEKEARTGTLASVKGNKIGMSITDISAVIMTRMVLFG